MHVFNKKEFIELNKHKCSELHYLDFNGVSIVLGEKGGELHSHFSAPFGGFSSLQKTPSLEMMETACEKLYEWLKVKNKKCHITLPPPLYNKSLVSLSFYSLQNRGFSIECTDLNYSLNLSKPLQPKPNFCRNLKTALKESLSFKQCENDIERKAAYEIINENRKERGYPPHLSFEELQKTGEIFEIDCFLLYQKETAMAGAFIYQTAPKIAQLILWGDNREYSKYRPMNLLAMRIAEHYKENDYYYFDLGPTSKNGIPNYGLSRFKSEMGCETTLKHTVHL
ncbi:MAG: GNAT family N-acetyltransferase [Fibromonadales bacterium]|nr:GNAT family N-acetyltransferase [Fibromonadales bacterium]